MTYLFLCCWQSVLSNTEMFCSWCTSSKQSSWYKAAKTNFSHSLILVETEDSCPLTHWDWRTILINWDHNQRHHGEHSRLKSQCTNLNNSWVEVHSLMLSTPLQLLTASSPSLLHMIKYERGFQHCLLVNWFSTGLKHSRLSDSHLCFL